MQLRRNPRCTPSAPHNRRLHISRVMLSSTLIDEGSTALVHRIDLAGESQRKRNKPPPLDGGSEK